MGESITIKLLPLGETIRAKSGTPLKDMLFRFGAEFPCGGQGSCRGCRIRVLEGRLPVTAGDREGLSPEELGAGWRLACRAAATGDLTLELHQWQAAILSDDAVFEFTPREGRGVAVDLGTTTLVAQLLDLATGRVRAVKTALNPQARFGSDIMSRIHYAVIEGGQRDLRDLIRGEIEGLVESLHASAGGPGNPPGEIVLAGNTVMHHLFCGIDLEPLARYPFETPHTGLQSFEPAELGWTLQGDPCVQFLPCLESFVGSDILAGILAVGLAERDAPTLLVDLGTNGEIVLGSRGRILCASTAAGPAFEAGRITRGMRASQGAIHAVRAGRETLVCETLGSGPPRGLCGSGLVDAVAAGLDLGWIDASGRLTGDRKALPLTVDIEVTQGDIRELQLAKGAIAAGIHTLVHRLGVPAESVESIHLSGAFGNYVNRASARRIGLLDFEAERIFASGNTSLRGAKMALLLHPRDDRDFKALRARVEHVALSTDPAFQNLFMDELSFGLSD